MKNEIIEKTETFVQNELGKDATGHDWFHIERVRRNALYICKQENTGEPFIVEMAALLHDISDEKLNETVEIGQEKLRIFLQTLRLPAERAPYYANY